MANIRKTFNFREGVKVDDSVLVVAGDRVGIGTDTPVTSLDVKGDARVLGVGTFKNLEVAGISTFSDVKIGSAITITSSSGIITATSFYGDGSTLTNIPTSKWIETVSGIHTLGSVGVGTTNPQYNLQIGGDPNELNANGVVINSSIGGIQASGIITANKFIGDGSQLTNIPGSSESANSGYATTAGIATVAQGLTGTPDINVGELSASNGDYSGIVTATSFDGDLTGTASVATVALGLQAGANSVTENVIAGVGSFGSVGIGTTNPSTDIQIVNPSNAVITLGRESSATGNNGSIGFGKVSPDFPYSGEKSLDIINYGTGNINFHLEAGTTGVGTGNFIWHRRKNFAQLMTLTYDSKLGIGITQPNHSLHVVGTSTVTSDLYVGNDVNVAGDINVVGGFSAGSFSITSLSANLVGNVYASSGVSTFNELRTTNYTQLGTNGGLTVTTNSFVGIATTNPQTILQVGDIYGSSTSGIKTFTAAVGVAHTIDTYDHTVNDFKTSEYTFHIGIGTKTQSQKVLVMQDKSRIYYQEFGVMYSNDHLVSIGATLSGSNINVELVPETGVSGLATFRFSRQTLL